MTISSAPERPYVCFESVTRKLPLVIDGVTFDIPDTPANVAAFGRPRTRRNGESVEDGYPQLHAILLAEVGTHTIGEALIKPGKSREYPVAGYLLAKAPRGSLVL